MFGFDAAAWLAVDVYEDILVGVRVQVGQSFVYKAATVKMSARKAVEGQMRLEGWDA